MQSNTYVVIMAGGVGSRFWPESRQSRPKQFLDLLGTGKSLLQWTYERFLPLCPPENIFFITAEAYTEAILEQLPGVPAANIIPEPARKNTAICAAYASYKIRALNPEATIIVSPSDHLILHERDFEDTVRQALRVAETEGSIVTLGIRPTRPDTGYGYLRYDRGRPTGAGAYPVLQFTEKPARELAEDYLRSGDFLWNSGLFVWPAPVIVEAFRRFLPQVHTLFSAIAGCYNTEGEAAAVAEVYAECPDISIDYGIMERADNVVLLPASFGWSDLGTWESAYDHVSKDAAGNAILGKDVIVKETNRCIIKAPYGKMVVVQGVENLIIIDTKDALLICDRSAEQAIRQFVAEVQDLTGELFI